MKTWTCRWLSYTSLGCFVVVVVAASGCSSGILCGAPEPTVDPTPVPTAIPTSRCDAPTRTPYADASPELDVSLLTDEPCRAPCWHNIVPGVSGQDDVLAQLEDSPFVREGTLGHNPSLEGEVPTYVFYWKARGERYNRIVLRDETVLRLEIGVDHDWTLGDAVDKFGPPEYVYEVLECEEGCVYGVTFYYPSQGLSLDSITLGCRLNAEYHITRDLKVTWGEYFAPTTLEGMWSEAYLCPPDNMEVCMSIATEWRGFQKPR